jgi:hypothetical protein
VPVANLVNSIIFEPMMKNIDAFDERMVLFGLFIGWKYDARLPTTATRVTFLEGTSFRRNSQGRVPLPHQIILKKRPSPPYIFHVQP